MGEIKGKEATIKLSSFPESGGVEWRAHVWVGGRGSTPKNVQ
ncbi:hypothetical protein CPTD_00129 [Corynebacterium pseudotuberculosis]|nr:Hypothetical protein BFF96_0904 [Corynebacterium pseudotuberculosis]AUY60288.1 Hypothetical protein BFG00_0900 [Corynebacterium pseudotuberculosis]KEX88391.1 hypothetical protein CPTD_00129 [Corynebacterium pseudotuberculosis]